MKRRERRENGSMEEGMEDRKKEEGIRERERERETSVLECHFAVSCDVVAIEHSHVPNVPKLKIIWESLFEDES